MGDNRASSSSSRGGRGAGAETLVADHGRRRSSCGYCRSTTPTSISHGLWAYRITADDYQELLDRGWRRSGCFMYKPEMEKTCCPSYTIRLRAGDYVPSKEQVRVNKKMQRFLDGTISIRKPDQLKDKPNSPDGLSNRTGNSSSSSVNQSSGGSCEKVYLGDEIIHYLSIKINDAVNTCVEIGELPSTVRLPDAVVKRVYPQAKRKLTENSEDLLYTSSISFQIVAVLRRSLSPEENSAPQTLLEISPNTVAEKLASYMVQNGEPSGMLISACNGHLNFYSTTKQAGSPIECTDTCIQTSMVDRPESEQSSTTLSNGILPCKRRKLEIRMKRSSFDPEEFALYRRYQIKVHDDKPEKVTESSYRRFLVDTPIIFVPPRNGDKTIPPCGFGSFHQQYLIDGKLVAVGVVDVLPKCLSSKYLFWDPDFAFLSLGKYSALQEINWVKESEVHCPSLQYYYLGYYIHSCSKMRYKAAYRPSELLCPLRYEWVPFDVARPLLDKKPYVVLSDSLTHKCRSLSPQISTSSSERSGLPDNPDQKEASSDEDEEEDLDSEGFGTGVDSESDSESCSVLLSDDLTTADIGNIVIDLNGSRLKLKDLQQVFGPIPKRHFVDLEIQLRRYVRVVGKELANRMVYSLG